MPETRALVVAVLSGLLPAQGAAQQRPAVAAQPDLVITGATLIDGGRSGGPGAAEPNGATNATMYREPGNYAWYCQVNIQDGVPHVFAKGMAGPLVVKQRTDASSQSAPEASVVVRLLDYAFTLSAPLSASRHVIKVENLGVEPHEVASAKLAPAKTMADVQAWIKDFHGAPPASSLGGVNALAADAEAYFEVDLTPGEYVVLCFVVAPDGRPHVEHGMIQGITA